MQIKIISIKNVYRRLSIDLKFNDDLNILVGINGSGKTTVIKIIDWLLTPNYQELANNDFEKLSITIELDGENYEIIASPVPPEEDGIPIKGITVTCLSNPEKVYHPIIFVDGANNVGWHDRVGFQLSTEEMITHEFIKSLGGPLIVSLDRKITAEVDDELYREGGMSLLRKKRAHWEDSDIKTPLEYVQDSFRQAYARIQTEIENIDARLRKEIILATLSSKRPENDSFHRLLSPEGFEKFAFKSRQIMKRSGVDAEIQDALSAFLEDSSKKVYNYESRISYGIIEENHSLKETLDRVAALMGAFRLHQFRRRKTSQPVDRYIQAVNDFLNDTGKEIFIDRRSGRLRFKYYSDNEELSQGRPLEGLSSGEMQILIILGLLGLNDRRKRIFIIDEPELSLHPKWQANFMTNVQLLAHGNAQLIVATHSPEIVASKKNKCLILR